MYNIRHTNKYAYIKYIAYNAVICFILSGPKLVLLLTLWIGLIAKLSSEIKMHAYTNYI